MNDNYELNGLSVGIPIHEDIASMLGIYKEKIVGNNLEDFIDKGIFEKYLQEGTNFSILQSG